VCTTLFNNGFDVLLIGRKFKKSNPILRNYKTYRFKLLFNKGSLFYAEYNVRLFFILLFSKKNILLSNDLDTLLANYLVSKISKTELVYDSHELFTEVPELINRPLVKNFWLKIEKYILPKVKRAYTVSDSIALYYKKKYNSNFKVIRNVPLQIKNSSMGEFPFNIENKKIILYQGALNKGRGIELIIDTIKFIENAIFVIIGNGDIEYNLKKKVEYLNLQNKVKFIAKITPTELKKLTPLADLGISSEENLGLNYNYALPNKLFDYIQAQIPVLVSNLDEMKQIVLKYKVGEIIIDKKPKALAKQIYAILLNGKYYYSQQLKKASKDLCWENEEKKLIEIFEKID
jgi:glycosyltransferase involved in cell wall biosynthesis